MAELTSYRIRSIHDAVSKTLAATMFLTADGEMYPEKDAAEIMEFMEQLCDSIRGNRSYQSAPTWRDARLLMLGALEECKRRLEARDA